MTLKIAAILSPIALILAACGPAATPPAQETPVSEALRAIEVSDAWAAATPSGARVAAGYLTISGGSGADRLVGASSPRASAVEIHEMAMTDGMMQMRPVEGLDIPADGSIAFAPGGLHLMFVGITAPFEDGDSIPLTLRFEHAGDVQIELAVRQRGREAQQRQAAPAPQPQQQQHPQQEAEPAPSHEEHSHEGH